MYWRLLQLLSRAVQTLETSPQVRHITLLHVQHLLVATLYHNKSLIIPYLPSPLLRTISYLILVHYLPFPYLTPTLYCTVLLVISCVSDREGSKSRSKGGGGGSKSRSQSLSESQLLGRHIIGKNRKKNEVMIIMMLMVMTMMIMMMRNIRSILCSFALFCTALLYSLSLYSD